MIPIWWFVSIRTSNLIRARGQRSRWEQVLDSQTRKEFRAGSSVEVSPGKLGRKDPRVK